MKMLIRYAAVCSALLLSTGCSIKRVAINQLGNALASGGSTFTSDDDPELVEAAIPFGLKLYESLLAESPKHTGLLLAAARASPNTPTLSWIRASARSRLSARASSMRESTKA